MSNDAEMGLLDIFFLSFVKSLFKFCPLSIDFLIELLKSSIYL